MGLKIPGNGLLSTRACQQQTTRHCLAIIASSDAVTVRTQYDAILAALSYDWVVQVVFSTQAAKYHLATGNKNARSWKALSLYGIDTLYCLDDAKGPDAPMPAEEMTDSLVAALQCLTSHQTSELLKTAQWII